MLNRLLQTLRDYYAFSQQQLRQLFLLLLIMAALLAAPFIFFQEDAPYDPTADQQTLDSLVVQLDAQAELAAAERPERYRPKPIKLYRFNPNDLSVAQWQELGLSKYIAQRILNFRTKAGDFKSKAQLQKIYGLPDSLFQRWYPYINLPDENPGYARNNYKNRPFPGSFSENRPKTAYPRKSGQLEPFDLNTADTTVLKQIRGIGSKLSARIVSYREKVGGFQRVNQVAEVYGISPEVADSLLKYGYVAKTFEPQKINLNTATFDQLRLHPYIGYGLAKAIINYRTQNGPFATVEALRKIKLLDQAAFEKLQPYVQVE